MARIDSCPDGHKLKLSIARAGKCDGCGRFVDDGERVQNCHACNWYLCDDCRPMQASIGAPQDFWGAIQNLFLGDVCSAPVLAETEQPRRRRPKKSKAAQRSQAESAGTHNLARARKEEAGEASAEPAPTASASKELAHSAGADVEQRNPKPAAGPSQPLDLLDDLDLFFDAKQQDSVHPPMSSAAAVVGGA